MPTFSFAWLSSTSRLRKVSGPTRPAVAVAGMPEEEEEEEEVPRLSVSLEPRTLHETSPRSQPGLRINHVRKTM